MIDLMKLRKNLVPYVFVPLCTCTGGVTLLCSVAVILYAYSMFSVGAQLYGVHRGAVTLGDK